MARRRKASPGQQYSCPISSERQARLEQLYNRDDMRRWGAETGIANKVLNLIIAMDRERKGLSTDPKTWQIVSPLEEGKEESREQDDQNPLKVIGYLNK